MNHFEEELKRRFTNAASAPEEVDDDALWGAIAGELPVAVSSSAAGRLPWHYLWFGLLLLLVGTGLCLSTEKLTAVAMMEAPSLKIPTSPLVTTAEETTLAQPTAKLEETPLDNRVVATNSALNKTASPSLSRPLVLAAKTPLNTTASSSSSSSQDGTVTPEPSSDNLVPPSSRRSLAVVSRVQSLAVLPLLVPDKLPELQPNTPLPFKKQSVQRFSFGLFSGTHLYQHRYLAEGSEEDLAQALNATRGKALDHAFSLEVRYALAPRLRVVSGLEYQRHHTTFSYVNDRDTTITHPSFPNQTTAAVLRRTVDQNNFQKVVSVPLLLEYDRQFGVFSLGLTGGVVVNRVVSQSGKLLDAEFKVVPYGENTSTPAPVNDNYLAYLLRPSLSYRLGENTWLQARVSGRYQQFKRSELFGLNHQAWQLGGSLGLIWRPGKSRK